ncbi:MAG: hypothetical protein R3F17_14965 [Planctomycetota bacterium]
MGRPDSKRLLRNLWLIRVMAFTWMFMILMPVVVPFFKSRGLDDGDIFLVQSIFSGAVALLEIPTGYVSDLLGANARWCSRELCTAWRIRCCH